jgi:very-short-patch-repair endonuclease
LIDKEFPEPGDYIEREILCPWPRRPKRILIYADGLEFHSGLRQRIHDTRQSNQLQTEGWQVLRFLGPHVHRNSTDCVTQLQNALGLQKP